MEQHCMEITLTVLECSHLECWGAFCENAALHCLCLQATSNLKNLTRLPSFYPPLSSKIMCELGCRVGALLLSKRIDHLVFEKCHDAAMQGDGWVSMSMGKLPRTAELVWWIAHSRQVATYSLPTKSVQQTSWHFIERAGVVFAPQSSDMFRYSKGKETIREK